jgi:predicted dehydrogenase
MNEPDRREFLRLSAGGAALALATEFLPALEAAPQAGGLQVALVGCGKQGRAILGELSKIEGLKVAALCDVFESRIAAAKRRAGEVPSFKSHQELLAGAPNASAWIVATPTHLHREIALAALAAGKHVYCEAPIAATLEDARAIARAARGSKSVFQAGLLARSNPVYQLAHSFAKSGALRDPVRARAQFHKKTSWRASANNADEERAHNWLLDPKVSLGLLGEAGTHSFDVAHWFWNAYPVAVRASGSLQFHKDGREVPDTVACELEFAEGRRLSYSATLANSFEGQHEVFQGSMATIKLAQTAGWMFKEADAPTQGWEVYANRQQFHEEQGITLIADATKLAKLGKLKEGVGLPNPPLYYALADFVKSVVEQKPVACGADEGLRAAAVAIRAHEALVTGERVEIREADLKAE